MESTLCDWTRRNNSLLREGKKGKEGEEGGGGERKGVKKREKRKKNEEKSEERDYYPFVLQSDAFGGACLQ